MPCHLSSAAETPHTEPATPPSAQAGPGDKHTTHSIYNVLGFSYFAGQVVLSLVLLTAAVFQ